MNKSLLMSLILISFFYSIFSKPAFINYTCVDQINDIAIRKDTLWLATEGGIALRNNDGDLLKTYTNADGIQIPRPSNIAIDKQGKVWFTDNKNYPYSNSVVCLDRNTFELFDTTNGLGRFNVLDIVCDSAGSVWFLHEVGLSTKMVKEIVYVSTLTVLTF